MKLVGHANFKRVNPMSDRFEVHKFHHIEFWCGDATNTYKRFSWGLGMTLVAKSDQSTSNATFASYVLQSNDLVFTLTAPYSRAADKANSKPPMPWFEQQAAFDFTAKHGLAVRAVGIAVGDAQKAYEAATANGAIGVLPPTTLEDAESGTPQVVAEVQLYGDVVLRFVSGSFQGPFIANYAKVDSPPLCYGLDRLDHAVGNVPRLLEAVEYIARATGFHEFAEFTAADVGTVDSGLNSMVLASNNEMVLLPVNEPTTGTPRKSQIQTYLEQNEGPGLQHLALKTDNIFETLREMRKRSHCGGFEFMPRPSADYYKKLPAKVGNILTTEQYKEVEELGMLVDKDDQGVLLQIFSKPLGDRPTVFVEIIQRIGCMREVPDPATGRTRQTQAGGCGGFGKGNFSELFKSIEDYERTLDV
ncbi:hypothetical protein WJX72_003032 [[Myrmecia] bisecta]|uniref:4-hydroxyphenylpyruvate dioxygenase n=1 Tax=[Myrmecia] bisecta TaxID=41462 RepID=A0AAW1Q8T0_9CHLO